VRESVVVICDYLIKESQHILEKRNKRKKWRWVKPRIMRRNTLGASNTLSVEWTSEDRDMYKNHLRVSREQFFFRIIIKSKTIHRETRYKRVICGELPKVNRRWTKAGHRQVVHPSTPLITSVERNCLHGSLWLIQPCWSTWGTRVNAP
jgi:hypothetical protein